MNSYEISRSVKDAGVVNTFMNMCFFKNVGIRLLEGYAVAQLFEALSYKPEGRGFDSRWCQWDFSLT